MLYWLLAQLVEHLSSTRKALGPIPSTAKSGCGYTPKTGIFMRATCALNCWWSLQLQQIYFEFNIFSMVLIENFIHAYVFIKSTPIPSPPNYVFIPPLHFPLTSWALCPSLSLIFKPTESSQLLPCAWVWDHLPERGWLLRSHTPEEN